MTTPSKKNAEAPAQKNAPPEEHGLIELQVWSKPPVNHQLLICHRPEDDGSDPTKLVSVIVRSSENFLKGMKLKARRVADKRYSLEGPCPRWRGRW